MLLKPGWYCGLKKTTELLVYPASPYAREKYIDGASHATVGRKQAAPPMPSLGHAREQRAGQQAPRGGVGARMGKAVGRSLRSEARKKLRYTP